MQVWSPAFCQGLGPTRLVRADGLRTACGDAMSVSTGTATSPDKEGNRPQHPDILQFGHWVPQATGWSAVVGRHEGERDPGLGRTHGAEEHSGDAQEEIWVGGSGGPPKLPKPLYRNRINCVCGGRRAQGQGEWGHASFKCRMIIGSVGRK